jgi:MSHA type pilus biogenesis protein MshL
MAILSILKKSVKLAPISVALLLCTCTQAEFDKTSAKLLRDPIDWQGDLTRDDIRETLRPERKKAEMRSEAEDNSSIPPLSSVVLAPDAPEINSTKKVSMSITENIDLKDVLQELARLAELELALDPNISGGIILSVQNRNVGEVLEMVADLAELKYTIDNGILKVVRDHPYLVHYNVDYLNIVRSSKGNIDTKTSTGSSSGGSGSGSSSSTSSSSSSSGSSSSTSGGTITSGSTNSISTEYDGDLWTAVEKNIDNIVKSTPVSLKKGAAAEPVAAGAAGTAAAAATTAAGDGSTFSVNKQAGIISVETTFRKHKAIQSYLDQVMANSSAQVLIEAKVIEVELNEAYSTGINWSKISGTHFSFNPSYPNSIPNVLDQGAVLAGTVAQSNSRINFFRPNRGDVEISGFLDLLQGFGVTRTLSNPRVTIINNQQAVLTFATNQPYFNITASPSTTTSSGAGVGTTTAATFTTTLNTVPIGVIMAIQPSINTDTQEITLHVRPTLTNSTGTLDDPSIKLNSPSSNVENKIPIVQVRELDTVLKAKSGDVMVIGGLIQHKDSASDKGMPFFQEIPLFGNLVKQTGKTSRVTETVILLQAVIVPTRSNYHPQDKKIYETFTQDPRPLVF